MPSIQDLASTLLEEARDHLRTLRAAKQPDARAIEEAETVERNIAQLLHEATACAASVVAPSNLPSTRLDS